MTIGQDYPDYQSYANWRGPSLEATNTWSLSASNPINVSGYVTNYASLVVYVIAAQPLGTNVAITFWTDETETVNLGGYDWEIPNGDAIHLTVPILGNFMTASVTTLNGIGATTFVAFVPMSVYTPAQSYHSDQDYVEGHSVSIPASTVDLFPLPYVQAGSGYVFLSDGAATGKLVGGACLLTAAGAFQNWIATWNPIGIFEAQSFVVPSIAMAVRIQNTDTIAHTVEYYCCVDGR